MILQKDTKELYKNSELSTEQLYDMFGDYEELEKEYDEMWDSWILQESIESHITYGGNYAGSGTLDYIEGKILYFLVRQERPKLYLEIGVAQGVSTAIVAEAMKKNKEGLIFAVDKDIPKTPCPHFEQNKEIIKFFQDDALHFTGHLREIPDIIFVDADHSMDFCMEIADKLKNKWPKALIVYHEWSLSSISKEPETDYISRREWLGKLWERVAFEITYNESKYTHLGFIGSCGLGVVLHENHF